MVSKLFQLCLYLKYTLHILLFALPSTMLSAHVGGGMCIWLTTIRSVTHSFFSLPPRKMYIFLLHLWNLFSCCYVLNHQ